MIKNYDVIFNINHDVWYHLTNFTLKLKSYMKNKK